MKSYASSSGKSDALGYGIELAAWGVALVGYFGPWVAHDAAALAWNAFDLFDILRVLPEIETFALSVNLYALRLPVVGLAVLLPVLAAKAHGLWRWGAALLGAALLVNTLPPYNILPSAWHTPGWRVPFWWGVSGLVTIGVLTALNLRGRGSRRSSTWRHAWVMLLWLLLTGIPAFITFPRLLPALERLYAAPVTPGWGFWTCGAGLLILGIHLWMRSIVPVVQKQKEVPMNTQTEVAKAIAESTPPEAVEGYAMEYQHVRRIKERYEGELLAKANVVGVGIGLRSSVTRSETLTLIVNVTRKVPPQALKSADRIPSELEGVPVAVETIGQPMAQPAEKGHS
ncbi:MAG: hypothetical protein JW892_06700 [Anaerolineae bacterium]|nr:hypothetical protein [Anaerolineae bacterium]